MYARPYPRPRPVGEVLELVELGDRRDVRTEKLSGGQRRRLDLALALIGDPDVLFLDEPTTGFDPAARRQAWSTIRALCDLGKTVFLTTHFMDEARFLADTVAVLAAGRLVAIGPPAELTGSTVRPAEISFRLPDGMTVRDLPRLDGATVAPRSDGLLVTTTHAVSTAHRLTGWALERGVELGGFEVTRPSLEDVYLDLTAEPMEAVR
jgi:ABC-2 type transport system ATP-binding protein